MEVGTTPGVMRSRNPLVPSLQSRRNVGLRSYLAKIHAPAERRPKPELVTELKALPWPELSANDLRPGPDQPLDILLPLGAGSRSQNMELRFALRSIERYASGWRTIWIVGVDPGFLASDARVRVVECEERGQNHESRIALKLQWTFASVPVADHCVLWNDDYVLTKPVELRTLEFYQRGSLMHYALKRTRDRYGRALGMTARYLQACGLAALHYDIHVPIIYERRRFVALRKWWEVSDRSGCGLVVKSVYANNFLREPGPKMEDLKIRKWHGDDQQIQSRWVYSYADTALVQGLSGYILNHWPEPSRFERGAASGQSTGANDGNVCIQDVAS